MEGIHSNTANDTNEGMRCKRHELVKRRTLWAKQKNSVWMKVMFQGGKVSAHRRLKTKSV